jgi:uncharacterized FlaG/YvyC family protein
MIGKLLNLPYQKFAKTVHGEMEQNKRRSQQQHSEPTDKEEEDKEAGQGPDSNTSNLELKIWIDELNVLDCYTRNLLKFSLSLEGENFCIKLIDQNNHTLQEYLPVQFKALYLHLKKDKDDSKKGTILNLNC